MYVHVSWCIMQDLCLSTSYSFVCQLCVTLHKMTFDKIGYFVFQRPERNQVHPLTEGSQLAMFQSLLAELNDK